QGQRFQQLRQAEKLIAERIGPIVHRSSYYETEAWGKTDQADFINQALAVQTRLPPLAVLQTQLAIEQALGRVRKEKWAARHIDIDLLFYANQVLTLPELTLPHPQLHLRNFVLIPMMEIAANFLHPILKMTIEELYLHSRDQMEVRLLEKATKMNLE
ncbi:MAG: 2-amino-4-hydroxy-6-hydroxymethyldihydropteridine diphosphokinase, partial [Bacteroidota bacterium]